MRGSLAGCTINRISSSSLVPINVRTSSRSTATIYRQYKIHQFSSITAVQHSRPSSPRFQSNQYGRIENSSSVSSSKDSFPATLANPNARRRNNKPGSGNAQPQSHGKDTYDLRSTSKDASVKQKIVSSHQDEGTNGHQELSKSSKADQSNAPPLERTSTDPASQPPKTISDRIKGLWENIKYLFRFYYNGVKQIWKDRALVQAKRKEIAERAMAGKGSALWSEKAMIELHQADVRKLPLFLAILIILEEILPLVVIYAPSLLPSTCILPSQSLKMRAEEERRRGLAIQRMAKEEQVRNFVDKMASGSCDKGESSSAQAQTTVVPSLSSLEKNIVRDVANVFGLRSWGPSSLVISRIEKHLRFLQEDDELLQKAYESRDEKCADETQKNEWNSIISSNWLWRACGRRGIRSSEADESTMARNLEAYLHLVKSIKKDIASNTSSHSSLTLEYAFVPFALYDGTPRSLYRLQGVATKEQSKGLRKRTKEVVDSVVQEEKRKEGVE